MLQRPVSSGATLIVAPHSITHQWVDEILRHVAVDALQIFVSVVICYFAAVEVSKLVGDLCSSKISKRIRRHWGWAVVGSIG